MRARDFRRVAALALIAFVPSALFAQTFTVLHAFTGGSDGQSPSADLIFDTTGNLYGTTYGILDGGTTLTNCGTIFKIDTKGKETILHRFHDNPDGCNPLNGHMIFDGSGNLYGTTDMGGAAPLKLGRGTVFKLNLATHKLTLIYTFSGLSHGAQPRGTLVRNAAGTIFGTAADGGTHGFGAVFKITSKGAETLLHNFQEGSNNGGVRPEQGLIEDGSGNMYGVAEPGGGITDTGGNIFKITESGKETTLYHFTGGADGGYPLAPLFRDAQGNLYGTTNLGGANGLGTIFKFDTAGKETVLYSFSGIANSDGAYPAAGLTSDGQGNFYGTTYGGGLGSGFGTIFKVDASGQVTILHRFPTDGSEGTPSSGLVRDQHGNLYGVTSPSQFFPTGFGIVYKLTP
jgi:uncharacterized repeat protein (TIGR03803 family)